MNTELEFDEDVMIQLRGAFEAREAPRRVAAERKPFEVKARPMGIHDQLDSSRISNLP